MNISDLVILGLFTALGAGLASMVGLVWWWRKRRTEPWVLVDELGQRVGDLELEAVEHFGRGLAPAKVGETWGYLGMGGQWVVQPSFAYAGVFDESGYAPAQPANSTFRGLLDTTGRWVVEPHYHGFGVPDATGLVAVVKEGSTLKSGSESRSAGLFDLVTGSWRLEPGEGEDRWTNIRGPGGPGRLVFEQEGCWRLADTRGGRVCSAEWQQLFTPSDGRIVFEQQGRFGMLDLEGRVVVPARYRHILPLTDGVASAQLDDGWQLIDPQGRPVGPVFRALQKPEGGLVAAQQADGRWGFIDLSGQWVLEPQWAAVGGEGFRSGVARVASWGRRMPEWRWIDVDGHAIGPRARALSPFVEGRGFARGLI